MVPIFWFYRKKTKWGNKVAQFDLLTARVCICRVCAVEFKTSYFAILVFQAHWEPRACRRNQHRSYLSLPHLYSTQVRQLLHTSFRCDITEPLWNPPNRLQHTRKCILHHWTLFPTFPLNALMFLLTSTTVLSLQHAFKPFIPTVQRRSEVRVSCRDSWLHQGHMSSAPPTSQHHQRAQQEQTMEAGERVSYLFLVWGSSRAGEKPLSPQSAGCCCARARGQTPSSRVWSPPPWPSSWPGHGGPAPASPAQLPAWKGGDGGILIIHWLKTA